MGRSTRPCHNLQWLQHWEAQSRATWHRVRSQPDHMRLVGPLTHSTVICSSSLQLTELHHANLSSPACLAVHLHQQPPPTSCSRCTTFSTLVLKLSFSQTLSLHSQLSLLRADLLESWPLVVWQSLAVVVLVNAADMTIRYAALLISSQHTVKCWLQPLCLWLDTWCHAVCQPLHRSDTSAAYITFWHGVVDRKHVDGRELKQPLCRYKQRSVTELKFKLAEKTSGRFGESLHAASTHRETTQYHQPRYFTCGVNTHKQDDWVNCSPTQARHAA